MIVYLVHNNATGKEYVGQTVGTLKHRWARHCRLARSGSNCTIHRAIRKHGSDSFSLSVLATCSDMLTLNGLERHYISERKTFGSTGYNQTIGGDGVMTCRCHSQETRRRISEVQKGRKQSPEWVRNRIASQIGRPLSLEHRAKLSAWQKGKKLTAEHIAKLSASHMGHKASEETKAKMSATRKGRPKSVAHIEAIRQGLLQSKARLRLAVSI